MAEMDDLTHFFRAGSGSTGPVNLDWLDVDEKDYQAADRLPKQNLDITPDLKALWSHEDKPSTGFVPNTGAPRTMGDLSQAHGALRSSPEDLLRTARLIVMQTTDPSRIQDTLMARYDSERIKGSRTALASVFAERGLLGRYYIDAADFLKCHTGSREASDFVRRFANDTLFVKAKIGCGDCTHRQGGDHCGVFHKQIVVEVPYTDELADRVEDLQQAHGRTVQASKGVGAKERIRAAMLANKASSSAFSGRTQAVQKPLQPVSTDQLIAVSNLTKKKAAEEQKKIAVQQARPIVAMLRRELLKGRSKGELSTALRLAFDERDLRTTQAEWAPTYREAGLYGALYTTQESFDDCREGADFLAKHGSSARAVVAGPKCDSCIFSKVGRCLMYGKKLVKDASEILTPETVAQVLDEHKMAGRLPFNATAFEWGNDPASALKAIHEAAMSPKPVLATGDLRGTIERAHIMTPRSATSGGDLTKRSIVQAMRQYMNEGLYGHDLVAVLRGRYEVRDLAAARTEMRTLLAEQGLQGIKYIDPQAYDDYGHGCNEAGRKHRSRAAVRYAKVGEKCGSCVHQTRPGFCSVLNKQLVVEPPYLDKTAEQRAILATGRATEIPFTSLVNNGLSMMHEYQIQHGSGDLDLSPEAQNIEASVEFGNQEVKL